MYFFFISSYRLGPKCRIWVVFKLQQKMLVTILAAWTYQLDMNRQLQKYLYKELSTCIYNLQTGLFQVNLQKVGDNGDVSNYIPNSEWTLVKLHVVRNVVYYSCCAEPYPDVTYTIQIRRKPLFYVFNMILPCEF